MPSDVSSLSVMAAPNCVSSDPCHVAFNSASHDRCHMTPREATRALLNPHWQKFGDPPAVMHICAGVTLLIFCVVAVLGNGLVIFLFLRFRSLRTPGNLLIVNLALSDLLMAVVGFPMAVVSSFKGYWFFSQAGCQIYGFSGGLFGLLSINTLAGIAVDRYFVIVRSRKGRGLSTSYRQSMLLVALAWLLAIGWASPPLLGWNKYVLEGFGTSCSFDFVTDSVLYRSFVLSIGTGGFLVPLSIIVFCYVYIFTEIARHRRTFMRTREQLKIYVATGTNMVSRQPLDVKTAQIAFGCVVLFCISWTPYAVIGWMGAFGFTERISPWAVFFSALFAKGSTMYNPILYAISHPRFRKKVETLRRRWSVQTNTSASVQLQRVALQTSARDRSYRDTISRVAGNNRRLPRGSCGGLPSEEEARCDTLLLSHGCDIKHDSEAEVV